MGATVKRRKRKKAPRLTCGRRLRKHPGTSEKLKLKWAEPEYRAMMMEKRKAAGLRKKGKPSSRIDIPDGMHRHEAQPLINAAIESSKETMSKLKKAGVISDLDANAEEALQTALTIMRKPGEKKVSLAAARLVLEYTRAKPASKTELTVNKAEEWLAAITDKEE